MNTRTASCRPGIHHRDAVREFARSGRGRGVFALTVKEFHQAATPVLHVPVCLGAVAVTCNRPGNPVLNFTPELLADLFLGKIVTWN